MDHTLKVYAGTLYDQSRHESAQALSKQRADYLLLISTRKASTLSGPEIQTIIGLYVKHIERCMEAKLASHRRAFDEAGAAPSDEDLREILQDVNDAQRLEINQSLHVLQTFLRPRSGASPGLDTDQLTASLSQGSAHGHDRVLREWKVWGARVQLKTTAHGDDRQFMGMAIEEARKSIAEEDGRVHPKVGAVVVKDGQVLSVAHRGESPGSHAEYIALEEKLANRPVAGATVYTTLEPCTTRNHPKIPCAARLIERKVARVVIGMLDPDPRITGRGATDTEKGQHHHRVVPA